ncbi:hypothetical protein WR25_22438 [Diploscapter pachys]|uniref:39S ribosomal protein L55, mitochondrial n=1 Tax=Diploscapter pachys TaxID=2018661 RepID=A0A2A2LU69_9BILA|nr:hypothetical protein WR25_22438 [Diploscapter pachys]
MAGRVLARCCEEGPRLLTSTQFWMISERNNAWRACIGKITRKDYLYRYQTRVVQPDGSSFMIRSEEPRQVFGLPLDITTLNEDERRQRLAARKPKVKKIKEELLDDNFDEDEYAKLFGAATSRSENSKPTTSEEAPKPQKKKKGSKK